MSSAAKAILEAALKLPTEEREHLVEELAASLPSGFATKEIETAWAEEIQQRIAAADAGKIDSTPWEEARDELLAELKQPPRGR